VTDEIWLAATWPFVRDHLSPPPGRVLELGCGPLGGFVPGMRDLGYAAVGIDPRAPDGPGYFQVDFEDYEVPAPLDAVVACTSLHHVADLDAVLDRIDSVLAPAGRIVVVEWAHERFDQATARWCFERLGPDGESWLSHHRDHWRKSGAGWDEYLRGWVRAERLHTGGDILRGLHARFDTVVVEAAPYFFPELEDVTRAEEQAAIAAGLLQANGLHYVGIRRARP
jgi:SAM-dependent methyltransferase